MDMKAPYYYVQDSRLVVIEHPFILKDVSKAITSLGGAADVKMLLSAEGEVNKANLSLRPTDSFSRPVGSCIVTGSNVVLHIEVPKRTGRRRKRGTNDDFQEYSNKEGRKENQILSALHDNPRRSQVTAVGQIARTHRFRDPPDFVWSSSTNEFLTRLKDTLLGGTYDKTAAFKLDTRNLNSELIPPPVLTPTVMPWAYSYRQNIAVKTLEIDGQKHTFNSSFHSQRRVVNIRAKADSIPNPEQSSLDASMRILPQHDQELILRLRQHFNARPIWTRRGLRNSLRAEGLLPQQQIEHHVLAHVAYTFSSGPWRDALVRYGKDPRKDADMRVYQTMAFRTDDMSRFRRRPSSANSGTRPQGGEKQTEQPLDFPAPPANQNHVFDGQSVDISGKMWQVCDVTDQTLRRILDGAKIRETCDVRHSGWYCNGTWGKVRAIMKAQIRHIVETGKPLNVEGSRHAQKILRIPDMINEENWEEASIMQDPADSALTRAIGGIRKQAKTSIRGEQDDSITRQASSPREIQPRPLEDEDTQEDDSEGMFAVMRELDAGSEQEVSDAEIEQDTGKSGI